MVRVSNYRSVVEQYQARELAAWNGWMGAASAYSEPPSWTDWKKNVGLVDPNVVIVHKDAQEEAEDALAIAMSIINADRKGD